MDTEAPIIAKGPQADERSALISNSLSLISLNEIEKKLIEHTFEQAAELQNLKIKCQENDSVINNIRSEITKSHLGLEKLDELYNSELRRRDEVKSIVQLSEDKYSEVVKDLESVERKVEITSSLLNGLNLLNDEPEKALDADKSINQEIDQLIEEVLPSLNELRETEEEIVQLGLASEEIYSLISEKNKLIHNIKILVAENEALGEELAVVDNSGDDLELARREREEIAQLAEELRLKCAEQDAERVFLKNEIISIKEEIKEKKHNLNSLKDETVQIDSEILLRSKSVNGLKESIENIQKNIVELEDSVINENQEWENKLLEKKNNLRVQLEAVDAMTKDYSDLKLKIANYGHEEKDISNHSSVLAESIKLLEEQVAQLKLITTDSITVENLRTEEVEKAKSSINSLQENLKGQLSKILDLEVEFKSLLDKLNSLEEENTTLNVMKGKLLQGEKELIEEKDNLSNVVKTLERKVDELRTDDLNQSQLEDSYKGSNILRNVKSGIAVWREEMEEAIQDLVTQRNEREEELNNQLKNIKQMLEDAQAKIILQATLDELKMRDAQLAEEIENQEAEKIRLMAELKGTQDKIAATVNPYPQYENESSVSPSELSLQNKKNRENNLITSATDCNNRQEQPAQVEPENARRRRLYNPSTVSSTLYLDSNDEDC